MNKLLAETSTGIDELQLVGIDELQLVVMNKFTSVYMQQLLRRK